MLREKTVESGYEVEGTLREVAANLARVMAGAGEPSALQGQLARAAHALSELSNGRRYDAPAELAKSVLALSFEKNDLKTRAHETICKGALRLSAHLLLFQDPMEHFAGGHSVGLIDSGSRMLQVANEEELAERRKILAARGKGSTT